MKIACGVKAADWTGINSDARPSVIPTSRFPQKISKRAKKYFRPKMKSDIKRHIRHCEECPKFKSPKPAGKTPPRSIVSPRPLKMAAMDLVGPLPKSDRGNTYAHVMVDHFSLWPIGFSVDNIEAETVALRLQDFYSRTDKSSYKAKGGRDDICVCISTFNQ
eukprot:gene15470-biopygen12873